MTDHPRREAAATFLAVAIGVTGTLAVQKPAHWYYGVACIVLLLAWIATITGTPGPDDPPRGKPLDDGPWTDHVSTAGLSGTSWMP